MLYNGFISLFWHLLILLLVPALTDLVFQVLDSGEALANEVKQGYLIPTGLTVLFLNEDGLSYYDDQVIKIPSGKCAKQIGIFKYSAKSGMEKTVPIVGIRNK